MLVETALNALPTNIEFGQSGCLYVKDAPTNDEWNDFLDEAHKAN